MPDEIGEKHPERSPGILLSGIALLYASTAALNQDNQHDDKQDARNDPDNRGLIHFDSLPSLIGYGLLPEKRFKRIRHHQHSGTKYDQKQ